MDQNILNIDRILEEKRNSLSNKLIDLKKDYNILIINKVNDMSVIKNSLLKQIDVLTELINIIKDKIKLIQQSEL